MKSDRIKKFTVGIIFISTLVISSFSYADADPLKLESDIKKLQNDIKNLQQTQSQLEFELNKLHQAKSSVNIQTPTDKLDN